MLYSPPTEEDARFLFNIWGYETLAYERGETTAEVLLRSLVDDTHTIRRFEGNVDEHGIALWVRTDSDAWR
jgi:hypothetical protein